MSQRRLLLAGASLLLLGNLVSRVLGLVREQVIAGYFGESPLTSAFTTASTVPTLFYDLVIGGAISAALVPVLSDFVDVDDPTELGQVVSTLLIGAAGVLVVLVTLLVLAASPLAALLGAGTDPAVFGATVGLIRLVVPALFFLGLSGIAASVCYARRWFAYPAASVGLFNAGLIVTAVLLHRQLGIASLALGALIGSILQLAAVLPGLATVPLRLVFDPGHPAVARIVRLYAPVALGLVVSEVGVGIDRNLAWHTGAQSVAIMRFATTLVQLPLGLVATATSLAALPLLARLVANPAEFRRTLCHGLRLAVLAILPAMAFLVVFAAPVIRLIFERGQFSAADTSATTVAYLLYAPQLPFVAIDQLLVYAFYARKNTLTPMLVGLGGVGVYLGSALLLIGPGHLGLHGLILANTLQNSLHAVVLIWLLWREVGSLAGFGLGRTLARSAGAAVVASVAALALRDGVAPPGHTVTLLVYLVVGAVLVLGVYLAVLQRLGVEEIASLPRLLEGRGRARVA
jgi:putative peptidoglycan lipid II flippase